MLMDRSILTSCRNACPFAGVMAASVCGRDAAARVALSRAYCRNLTCRLVRAARLPLVFSGATLLAVGSLWVDESIQSTPGTANRARLVHVAAAS